MKPHVVFLLVFALLLSACLPAAPSTEPTAPTRDAYASDNPVETPTDAGLDPNQPVASDDGATAQPDFLPKAGDERLLSGTVYIDQAELLTLESFPVQFVLTISGNLPDPCHQLRIEMRPQDEQNNVYVDVYSLSDPDTMCIQVLQPFTVNFPLGSFPEGKYQLFLNGEKIADFQS